MPFPYDRYPWLNFQELNLAYFIKHFREIFEQWDQLYHDLTDWKEATDQDLADWKTATEAGLESWKTGLTDSLETWKSQTASDISGWKSATLAALDAWKTATTAVFEQIRIQAAGSASAAAASASQADTARAAAVSAQTAAEQAAAGISAELAQIQTNADDIEFLKSTFGVVASSNLLDELATSNGYLTQNGTLSVAGDWKTTDFIDVTNISSIVGSRTKDDGTRGPIGFGYICTYGADKTTVTNYYSDNRNVYTVEEGVQYVRISYHGAFREPMISIGTTVPSVYEPYGDYSKLVTSPESFGAIGDGVADDTAALQNAINSGAKYIIANGVYNVSTIYIDSEINFTFNEINGNIVIKGYRNNVSGKKLSGSAPLVIGFESNTASGNIIQIGYIYCSGYTTGDCILLDGSTANVMNNLFINCQTNRGAYGFHLKANTGFCNQNVMLMCVSTNAAQYGLFLENLATGTDAGSKMNGGRYYNYDPETSAGAVKMSGRCEDHKFYGLRTREFGNRAICFSFDANVRGIAFDNGFKFGQLQFIGDETADSYQSIRCEGMSSDTGGTIFTGPCEITGANNAVIVYPKTEQKLKLINITENTDFSYYTSDKNVSYNVFRNSNSATTGVQATAVLRGCFGHGKIDKVYSFANTNEIPPRIAAGGKYYTPPASPVSQPTLFEFDMMDPQLTFMKIHEGTLIQQ